MKESLQRRFAFLPDNMEKAKHILAKYPEECKEPPLAELLLLAQEQNKGWLSMEILEYISRFLELPLLKVLAFVDFYTFFQKEPVGTFEIRVCTSVPCWLRGSSHVMRACQKWLGIKAGETTVDGMFTLRETKCLGVCTGAPAMQINKECHEKLDTSATTHILENLVDKKKPAVSAYKKLPTSGGQNA